MNIFSKPDEYTLHELNNYKILEIIGKGSFGSVYKAIQKSTGQVVAIKLFNIDTTKGDSLLTPKTIRIEREIDIYKEINHPYIVKLLDKGYTQAGLPVAVFEYLEGITLKAVILQNKGLTGTEAQELMGQVLDALACAHAKGIIHRDLKPQNIMVSNTGAKAFVKVLDFGIGNLSHDMIRTSAQDELETVGTPLYSAPEQLRGEVASSKSDLYAWGLILLECLLGQTAISGNSISEIYHEQLNTSKVYIPGYIHEHPLGKLLERVLDKNPNTRMADTLTLFHEFHKLDFSTLHIPKRNLQHSPLLLEHTLENKLSWNNAQKQKRLITILGIKLMLGGFTECLLDEETIETIQQDQLKICTDVALRYGGYLSGSIADYIFISFGYPQASDQDARLASRTALEILNQVKKRSQALKNLYGLNLEIQLSVHSGNVFTRSGLSPEGFTVNIAFELLQHTQQRKILVSGHSRQLLEPYVEFENPISIDSRYTKTSNVASYLVGELPLETFSQLHSASAHRKMYGRNEELACILQVWNNAAHIQNGRLTLIEGEAGIGKSKLVFEFKKRLNDSHCTIIESRCLQEHSNNSFFPILEIFKKAIGIVQGINTSECVKILTQILEDAACDVAATLPVIASWLDIELDLKYEVSTLSPLEQKKLLSDSLSKCFIHITNKKTYLFVLEDLHWADPGTVNFLKEYSLHTTTKKHVILCTARPQKTLQFNQAEINSIQLKHLDYNAGKSIVYEITGHKTISEHALKYILDRTDGIPIFIEEFTAMLLAKGQLVYKNESYQLLEYFNSETVPFTLKGLLNARLDQLGLAKESAQLAATIGKEVDYRLLSNTSIKDETALLFDLEKLIDADLMYRIQTTHGDQYIFRHSLFKEAAYESQANAQKRQSHEHIAEVLAYDIQLKESKYTANEAEQLSHHLYESGNVSEAVDWMYKTAERLVRKSDNLETVVVCKKAIHWLLELPETQGRFQREFNLRQILITNLVATESYGSAGVGQQLDAISTLFLKLEWQEQLFPSMFLYSNYYTLRANAKAAIEISKILVEKAEQNNDSKWIIVASTLFGIQLMNDGQFIRAAQAIEYGLSLFDFKIHKELAYEFGIDQEILGLGFLANVYTFLGRHLEIFNIEAKLVEKIKSLEHLHSIASMYLGLSCTCFYLGNKSKVKEYSDALIALNQKHNLNMFGNYGIILNAWAVNDLERAHKAMMDEEATGIFSMRSFWYTIIASIELELGLFLDAQKRLRLALSFIGTSDGSLYAAEIHRLLAIIHHEYAEHELAKNHFQSCQSIATQQGAQWILEKAENLRVVF